MPFRFLRRFQLWCPVQFLLWAVLFPTLSPKQKNFQYCQLCFLLAIIFVSLFCSVLPLITFALESFCVRSGDYSTRTLQYWISRTETDAGNGLVGILFEPQVWLAFRNSILLSVSCCFLCRLRRLLACFYRCLCSLFSRLN